LLIVADGVGGWSEQGIDSGLFSKSLVNDIQRDFDAGESTDLKELLIQNVKRNENVGSSTIVMSRLDSQRPGMLVTTNLGDSGMMIYRPNKFYAKQPEILFKSKSQQYSFNFPYQCGTAGDGSP